MTLLEKLACIDQPKILILPNGNAKSVQEFWNTLVIPYLPKRDVVLAWHELLMEFIKTDHPTFAIRGYNSFRPENYVDLRRGFLTDTQDFSFFYTDNFFAFYIQKMCLDGFVPTVEELVSAFNNRQFPSRFGRNTAEERELLAVKQGKDPKISAAGFKLAHILPVGKGYKQSGCILGSKEILERYFPKGERVDWKIVNDKTGSYHTRQLQAEPEAKRYAIAHFLRFVHPFNYFLCPMKNNEINDKCKELAEYAPLLAYAHDYNLKLYGDAYSEFLSYCMVDSSCYSELFDIADNNVEIQYGIAMNMSDGFKIPKKQSIHKIKNETIINSGDNIGSVGDSGKGRNGGKLFKLGESKKNDGMDKKKAIALFHQNGYNLCSNVTFSSKTGPDYYWGNPQIKFLQRDWNLILKDQINKKLYLFRIHANAIHLSQIKTRSDQPNKIDLQIQYKDLAFTDKRSGVSFRPFFIKELDYVEHIQHKIN